MSTDLNEFLDGWEFDPVEEDKNIRRIVGEGGHEKIQIRIRCGVLQWEIDGRPDGKRPYGKDSMLQHCKDLIRDYEQEHGTSEGFQLSAFLLEEIRQELLDFYQRRVMHFRLGDFFRAKRDAEHSLELMEIVRRYADDPNVILQHDRFRALVMMDRTRAEAMTLANEERGREALDIIDQGINEIRRFYLELGQEKAFKKSPEFRVLTNLKKYIRREHSVPLSDAEILQVLRKQQKDAIGDEDYEKAGRIRDKMHAVMRRMADKT